MATPIDDYLKTFKQMWQGWNANQRLLAGAGAAALVLVLAAAVYWSSRPDFTVLFSNLNAENAGQVVEYLREHKIPYRLAGGGTTVEAPSRKIYEIRLALAGKGLPQGTGEGFGLFDKMSFGVTDEVQKINYLRALQSELEKTIDALDPIEKSRVHLVMPEEDLWFESGAAPSASVMVKLAGASRLTDPQVESIRSLLAGAVRGLTPERVTLVDTRGRVLSSSGEAAFPGALSNRQLEYRSKLEERLRQQAESLLTQILGPDRAVVRVNAEIDFDQMVSERELFTPAGGSKGLLRSERQNSVTPLSGATQAAGTVGTPSNLQGYPPSGQVSSSSSSKSERVANYEVNRTVERMTNATGVIRKLSVGAFLDGKVPAAQLSDIQAVLARSLGIDPGRGDLIEVRAIAFNRKALEEDKKLLEKSQRQFFWTQLATRWLPQALLLAAAVGLLVVGLRNLQSVSLKMIALADNGKHNGKKDLTAENLLGAIQQRPAESAQILKQWLS